MDASQPKDQFILNPINLIKLVKLEDGLMGDVESHPDTLTYSFHVVLWPIKENSGMVSGSTLNRQDEAEFSKNVQRDVVSILVSCGSVP